MPRWRAPQSPSTALITREGHDRLKAELDDLWRLRRPEVVQALAAAAAEGDRSENAEYSYRKKQLGEIDRRVRHLSRRLESLRVVEGRPADPEAVFFGAWVVLEDEDAGREAVYRIVGPDEIDAARGWISIDAPLARALLKKRAGESLEALLPGRPARFTVLAVRYDD